MSRRLVLWRHGQTLWNLEGRAQGHADVELDESGHEQAAATAPYLAALAPAALWSSDLVRARQTCAYLEKETGLSAKYDERLREFDVGERQGLTLTEFAEMFPGAHSAWVDGDYAVAVPGAEDSTAVRRRLQPALDELVSSLDDGDTGIVVTHGAALKVAVAVLLGWSAELEGDLRGVDNCAWATLEEVADSGRLRLVGYNESVRPGHDSPRML